MDKIENLKKNDFFRKKEGAKYTFQKGDYDRAEKAWFCQDYDDISECIFVKKGTKVFTNFTY